MQVIFKELETARAFVQRMKEDPDFVVDDEPSQDLLRRWSVNYRPASKNETLVAKQNKQQLRRQERKELGHKKHG